MKITQHTDKKNCKKRVRWESVELKQSIIDAAYSGDSYKLYDIIISYPLYRDSIRALLTENVEGNPSALMQIFFDCCDENIKTNEHNINNLSRLLLLLFKEIDVAQTKVAFDETRKCLKTKGLDYSLEVKTIFKDTLKSYIEECATSAMPQTTIKKHDHQDISSEDTNNKSVDSINPTKKARIEEDDDHSLTTEQKNEERKPQDHDSSTTSGKEESKNTLSSGMETNQRSMIAEPLTAKYQQQARDNINKKIHQDEVLVILNSKGKNPGSEADTNSHSM